MTVLDGPKGKDGQMIDGARVDGGGNGLGLHEIGGPNSPYRGKRPPRAAAWSGPKRFCTYARSSSEHQVGKSEDRQEERNKAYVAACGGVIVRSYVDSGLTGVQVQGRDALEEMLGEASKGVFDALCFEDVSRLARKRVDCFRIYSTLAVAGIELHASTFGKLDIYALAFQAYIAERERVDILGRMMGGRKVGAAQGRRVTAVHYGFVIDPHDRTKQVPDPELSPVIVEMFRMSAGGMTKRSIARAFTGKHPTPADRLRKLKDPSYVGLSPWCPATVGKLLNNPVYAGVSTFGRTRSIRDAEDHRVAVSVPVPIEEWITAYVPTMPLMGIDLWAKGQAASPGRSYNRNSPDGNYKYLFGEVLVCGGCGRRLKIHEAQTFKCPATRLECKGVGSFEAHRVESEVLRLLAEACASAPPVAAEADVVTREDRRSSLEREMRDARVELDRGLRSLCVSGAANDAVVARWKELDTRIQVLAREIAACRIEAPVPPVEAADLGEQILAEVSDRRFDTEDPAKARICALIRGAVRLVRIVDDGDTHRVEVDVALGAIWPGRFGPGSNLRMVGGMPRANRHPDLVRERAMREVRDQLGDPPSPSTQELEALSEALDRTTDHGRRMRLETVLLCRRGHRCHEAAVLTGATERDALVWLTAHREAGPDILERSTDVELLDFVRGRIDEACDRSIAGIKTKYEFNAPNSTKRQRLRKDALMLYIGGHPARDIEAELTMPPLTLQKIVAGVELVGPAGFHLPRRNPIVWLDGQFETILAIVAAGRDPDDPEMPVNMGVLLRICRDRYGFTCLLEGFRKNLGSRGVRIKESANNPPTTARKRGNEVRELVEDKVGKSGNHGRLRLVA